MEDFSSSDEEYESDISEQYDALLNQIEHLVGLIETTEAALHKLQRPILSLSTQQLGDLAFLESTPFRKQTFQVRMEADGYRRPFQDICAQLRSYIFQNTTVGSDGIIAITPLLRSKLRFKPRQKTTTYSELLGLLVYGVV